MRRIGVLIGANENDPEYKARVSALTQALSGLGWPEGRNLRMDLRWAGPDINRIQALAQELVRLQPDIILTNGTPATAALQRETQTIPIVFAGGPAAMALTIFSSRLGHAARRLFLASIRRFLRRRR